MKKIIPYGSQYIDKSDIRDVSTALSKDKITSWETTLKFEKKINKSKICFKLINRTN